MNFKGIKNAAADLKEECTKIENIKDDETTLNDMERMYERLAKNLFSIRTKLNSMKALK